MGINAEQLAQLKKGDTVYSGSVRSDRNPTDKEVISKGSKFLTIGIRVRDYKENPTFRHEEKIEKAELEDSKSIWVDLESYQVAKEEYLINDQFRSLLSQLHYNPGEFKPTQSQKTQFIQLVESFKEGLQ
jgi:hypothetical protein